MSSTSEMRKIPLRDIQTDPRYGDISWLTANWTTRFRTTKRLLDIGMAVPMFVGSLPLLLIVGILIRVDSKGPVIYSQQRLGVDGKPFTIYKLRSMRVDAERDGASYASANDPRVTRVGIWLRKTRIDEIPQLWNVIQGDMSLIGPRPERPENKSMLEAAIPEFHIRTCVRPGLTGWAQICAPYANTIEQSGRKLEFDLYYIRNASLWLDLKIAARTIAVMTKLGGQ